MTFDAFNNKIVLTTTTLISGTKDNEYNYTDISFKEGKDLGNFRKRATQFLEIYNKKNKLIRLEKVSIGEYAFDNILNEFQQLKNIN